MFFCSDFEQKMEAELLKLLRQTKEAGGSASLTISTRNGKMTAKLEVELDPPSPASPGSTSSSAKPTAPAAGGGRRRRKGAAAKAKAKARAAQHRATQAAAKSSPPASGDISASLDPPLRRPPRLLLSPSPTSGRRRVMSLGRLPMPSFGNLNLDGNPPTSPLTNPWIPCMDDCNIPEEHCEDCHRCTVLCFEHEGCACDPMDRIEFRKHWCTRCNLQHESHSK